MKLILASNSASRKEILSTKGYDFVVDPSDFDESKIKNDNIKDLVLELAKQKAISVANRHDYGIIIAADTLVYFEGEKIGQKTNEQDALDVLKRLNGKTHEIFTGICIINASNNMMLRDSVTTYVTLKQIPESDLEAYIKAGFYKGRAGCYNISDPGFENFVADVKGSYLNIRGMPIEKIKEMLEVIQNG